MTAPDQTPYLDRQIVDELTAAYWAFRERFPPSPQSISDERSHRTALSMTANYARIVAAEIAVPGEEEE